MPPKAHAIGTYSLGKRIVEALDSLPIDDALHYPEVIISIRMGGLAACQVSPNKHALVYECGYREDSKRSMDDREESN